VERAGPESKEETYVTSTLNYISARGGAIPATVPVPVERAIKPRSLDSIADDINKLGRSNIFAIGGLLTEAKLQCGHGQWAKWIWDNFEYSESTAQNYMKASRLAAKFPTVRDLKIGARTIYSLASEDEKHLPAIIAELAKHATRTRLRPEKAEEVMNIGRVRAQYPDDNLSDPAASQIGLLCNGYPAAEKIIAAIREQKPQTGQEVAKVVQEISKKMKDDRQNMKAERGEKEAVLDGPPPELPPPITPPEPQTLSVDEDDLPLGAMAFQNVMMQLRILRDVLRDKPLARFTDICTPKQLQEEIDYLSTILAMLKQEATP
jgi:hypothetical protein